MVNLREKRETSIPSSSKKVGKTDFTIIAAAGGITRKRKDPAGFAYNFSIKSKKIINNDVTIQ